MYIIDAHLDLSYNVQRGRDVRLPASQQPTVENEVPTVGLPDLKAGGVSLICATIFCSPATYRKTGYVTADDAHAMAVRQLDWYREQIRAGLLKMVTTAADFPVFSSSPLPALPFILLLEGADAFRNPQDVKLWYDWGLRIVGLSWRQNRMAGGTGFPGPITEEGRGIVRAMDELKMIHDASHLAEEAFWQLLDLSAGPVMASHSNCRVIVPGDRQLSDEMIKAIVQRDGVIGINFYDEFLLPPSDYKKRKARMSDLLAHIHRMCDLAGSARHVALGTDMDGGVGRDDIPQEIRTSADLPLIAGYLSEAGFADQDVAASMGMKWFNFFKRNLPR